MNPDFDVLLDGRALLGECPLWDHERGRLYWVDILRREVHTFLPDTGEDRAIRLPVEIGAVGLTGGAELVAAAGAGFATVCPDTGAFCPIEGTAELGDRMNDGACDPHGRFLAGTLTYAREPGRSGLYRLAATGLELLLDGLTLSNGIGWSPDGSVLYLIDTADRVVWAFDYDPVGGEVGRRHVLAEIDADAGNPDGLAVDAAGGIWVALAWTGRIHRYRADGVLDQVAQAPTRRITSLAFGGTDLRDVYVTAACIAYGEQDLVDDPHAGGLFRFRAGEAGMPSIPWQPAANHGGPR